MASEYQVLTWDQRGFGRSTNTADAHSPERAVGDLRALLDHLSIDRAHLLGQSMGGWAAFGLAQRDPQLVKSLIFSATPGGLLTSDLATTLAAFADDFEQWTRAGAHPLGASLALSPSFVNEHRDLGFLYQQLGTAAKAGPADTVRQLLLNTYSAEQAAELNIPMLFVLGEHDQIFPPVLMRAMLRDLPQASIYTVPGAGHSPYFERATLFNRVILDFIRVAD